MWIVRLALRPLPLTHGGRVRFARYAQDLGFSLEEIKELLSLRATRGAKSGEVKRRTKRDVDEINDRIHALEQIRAALQHLVSLCSVQDLLKSARPACD